MKSKKLKGVTILLLVMVILTACSTSSKDSNDLVKEFVIEDFNMSFMFPKSWDKVTSENPYDLQCTDGDSYASIFTYYNSVISEGESTMNIFNLQNQDIFSVTDNINTISEEVMTEIENKRIYSKMYSAKKDGIENYYYFNLIESIDEKEVFAWVMFTALPDYAMKHKDVWDKIVASAKWVE